jgi:hypothetical protein
MAHIALSTKMNESSQNSRAQITPAYARSKTTHIFNDNVLHVSKFFTLLYGLLRYMNVHNATWRKGRNPSDPCGESRPSENTKTEKDQ